MYQKIVQRALQGLPQEGLDTKSPTLNKDSSPYSVLYIREDAPDFIIKAVYKALVFEYHPDHGGNAEQFQTVKEAYEEIIGGAP
jgi:DnaJ-class molecular chaperone